MIRGSLDNGKASNVSGCGAKIHGWFRPLRDSNVMKTDSFKKLAPAHMRVLSNGCVENIYAGIA